MTRRECRLLEKRCYEYLRRHGYHMEAQRPDLIYTYDPNANRYAVVPSGERAAPEHFNLRLKDLCIRCGPRYERMANRYSSLVCSRTA